MAKHTEEAVTTSLADASPVPANDGTQETQMALALIETLKTEPAATGPGTVAEPSKVDTPLAASPVPFEIENPAPLADIPKMIEMPKPVEIPKPELIAAAPPLSPACEPAVDEDAVEEQPRGSHFKLLAASVSIAAGIGAMTGALMAATLTWVGSAPSAAANTPRAAVDLGALHDTMTKMRSEIAALRAGIDTGARSNNAQFAKVAERFDRIERATDPARLAKALEALERRADVTGSVGQQSDATPVPPPAPRAAVLDGWVIRNVSRGVALIQGRRMGVIEVERGDIVPGLGRIEAIRRQDGHWVVVTAKGLILPPR